jgi:hypothetical protein
MAQKRRPKPQLQMQHWMLRLKSFVEWLFQLYLPLLKHLKLSFQFLVSLLPRTPFYIDYWFTQWQLGEIADIAEIAATPALIQLCVKLIEKEGKAEFKIFGKKHTLSMDKPTAKPSKTRPPESSHTKPHTSTNDCDIAARDLNGRAPAPKCNKPVTSYVVTAYNDKNFPATKKMVCDFNVLNQACMNYASIIDHNPGYDLITCPFSKSPPSKLKRPIVALYNRERGGSWVAKIVPPSQQKGCERDEWPPAALHEINNGLTNVVAGANVVTRQQYVRLLDGVVNGKAGNFGRAVRSWLHPATKRASRESSKARISRPKSFL